MQKIYRCGTCGRFLGADQFRHRKIKARTYVDSNKCKTCNRTAAHIWRAMNREKHLSTLKEYREREGYYDKHNAYCRDWTKRNAHKVQEISTRRRRAMRQGLVPEDANLRKIQLYYRISKYLGSDWQVDHIKPLAEGGLHHEDNLQIISTSDNRKKGSKLGYKVGLNFRI